MRSIAERSGYRLYWERSDGLMVSLDSYSQHCKVDVVAREVNMSH